MREAGLEAIRQCTSRSASDQTSDLEREKAARALRPVNCPWEPSGCVGELPAGGVW